MKAQPFLAAKTLKQYADDLSTLLPATRIDAALTRYIAAQLPKIPCYILPAGGHVIRGELATEQRLPVDALKFPSSSFVVQFSVTDSGFNPAEGHTSSAPLRLALVQDLSSSALREKWHALLDGTLAKPDLHDDSVLVLPINRIFAPGHAPEGPGNRGWIPAWAGAVFRRRDKGNHFKITYAPTGAIDWTDLPILPAFYGYTGAYTAARFQEQQSFDAEFAREIMLEVLATIDLGAAIERGRANLKRAPITPGQNWHAGTGPRTPSRTESNLGAQRRH